MLNINKTIIAGYVGSVEIKYTSGGEAVLNLSVATNKHWKDKDGNNNTAVQWHRVVVFGKLAQLVKDWVKKGTSIYLEGELRTRSWQDKHGADRWTTEVVLSGYSAVLQVLDKKDSKDSKDGKDNNNNKDSKDNNNNKDEKDNKDEALEVPQHQVNDEADDPSSVVPDDGIPF